MKKEIYIQIPEPCHEDWNKMTPVDQGRYCESCCKEVVDFSMMTDQQIIRFLSKPRGKTCGNFSSDQLNRVIKEPSTPGKKKYWAVMLSFLLPFFIPNRSNAQLGRPRIIVSEENKFVKRKDELRGDTIATAKPSFLLEGNVTDTTGNPIPFCIVKIKGTNKTVIADSAGYYKITEETPEDFIIIASHLGYKSNEVYVPKSFAGSRRDIVLVNDDKKLEDVVITSYPSRYAGRLLCMVTFRRVTILDTAKAIFNTHLKVYPNPARKSSFVNVQPSSTGSYQLKLIDNNGKIHHQASFIISAKHQAYQLELPSAIAAGMYYINLIEQNSKKQFTEKLIVQ